MNTPLATFFAFALAYAGMTGFSLAMDRHRRQLRPDAGPATARERSAWRCGGWVSMVFSCWASMLAWGPAVGLVAWFGVLMIATLLLVLLLPYAPVWARRLAVLACAAAPVFVLIWS